VAGFDPDSEQNQGETMTIDISADWITSDGGTPKYWRQKYIKR